MKDDLIAALEPLVRRVRTDVTAIRGTTGPVWTRDALTPERLAKHLNGGPVRGVCPIKAGEDVTMVAVLDLDSHKGASTWQEMVDAADEVSGALLMRGILANPWRSGGGNGVHLIIMWDDPQDAYSVRQDLVEALAECGYSNGTGGVSKRQIEVFPKQDSVEIDRFGNQFFLPLGGKSEPLIPALGYDPGGREAAVGMRWLISEPVAKRERPARPAPGAMVVADGGMLDRALFAIPNDLDDRDAWFTLMCAYKEGGGDKEMARQWTQQHPSYTDEGFDGPWDSIVVGKPGGTPVDYLLRLAEGRGFSEHLDDLFEAAPVVVHQAGPVDPGPWPEFSRDKQGGIESTATNAQAALMRPDFSGYQLGYDEFMGRRVIAAYGESQWRPFTDSDYFVLRVALEKRGFKRPSHDLVREATRCVSEHLAFDSAIVWGNGLRWDGKPRVEQFFQRYMGVTDTPYHRSVGLYLWTALAGRCMSPGCKVDMVPVLIGAQGSGKTSMVEALAPTDEAFIEINLAQRNEDQMARSLRGKLVGELAELRGLAGRDAEDIKAWITRRAEEIRALWAEFHARYDRRLVMIGTGNNTEFLSDDTGERRWLPLHVGATDLDALRADRDHLWAEGVALWRAGGVQWREAQTLALGEHAAFKVSDPWEESIARWFENTDLDGAPFGNVPVSVHDVLVGALRIAVERIGKREEMRAGKVLKAMGFARVDVWERGKNCKKWQRAVDSASSIA